MADALKISAPGLDELIARLNRAPELLNVEVKAELEDGANAIASLAKQLAPGDFGFLKNLIFATHEAENAVGVESGAAYSAYVEFGTGTKVDVPVDLEEFAIQYKGTHEVAGMRAQPFLFPAVNRQIPIIVQRITKILNEKI